MMDHYFLLLGELTNRQTEQAGENRHERWKEQSRPVIVNNRRHATIKTARPYISMWLKCAWLAY